MRMASGLHFSAPSEIIEIDWHHHSCLPVLMGSSKIEMLRNMQSEQYGTLSQYCILTSLKSFMPEAPRL